MKKFVHIPQAYLQSCKQFDTIQEAIAKVSNSGGILVEVAKSYSCTEEKRYVQVSEQAARINHIPVDVIQVKKQFKLFQVLHSEVTVLSAIPIKGDKISLAFQSKVGPADAFILPKNEVLLLTEVKNGEPGKTIEEWKKLLFGESTIQAANKSALNNGHVQKEPVKFGEKPIVTPVQKSSPASSSQRYRYLQYTLQGDFVGEANFDPTTAKLVMNEFGRLARRAGLAVNDPSITVQRGNFKYRRTLIK